MQSLTGRCETPKIKKDKHIEGLRLPVIPPGSAEECVWPCLDIAGENVVCITVLNCGLDQVDTLEETTVSRDSNTPEDTATPQPSHAKPQPHVEVPPVTRIETPPPDRGAGSSVKFDTVINILLGVMGLLVALVLVMLTEIWSLGGRLSAIETKVDNNSDAIKNVDDKVDVVISDVKTNRGEIQINREAIQAVASDVKINRNNIKTVDGKVDVVISDVKNNRGEIKSVYEKVGTIGERLARLERTPPRAQEVSQTEQTAQAEQTEQTEQTEKTAKTAQSVKTAQTEQAEQVTQTAQTGTE